MDIAVSKKLGINVPGIMKSSSSLKMGISMRRRAGGS